MSAVALTSTASTPQHTTRALRQALNRGDLDAAVDCFALDACFLTPDATVVRGRESIRPLLAQLIARQTQIEVLTSSVLAGGEMALVSEHWRISSAGAEGKAFLQESRALLVAREAEGVWRLGVAALWGWGAL